ncbi:toprim domain-containing protein [Nocardia tengchongensis]|uniref:toprim domain-containing protein n=1 Tax=Nocardia tengchongensis TaxID=2055889 RepID=UPI00368EF21F
MSATSDRTVSHAAAQGSWERITSALEQAVGPGRPAREWTKFYCPVHEADGRRHNPSLIAKYLPDEAKTKISCRAGCDDREVLASLGMQVRDLYDRPRTSGPDAGRVRAPRTPVRQPTRADRAIDAAGLALVKPKRELGPQVSPWRQAAVYTYERADGSPAGEVIRHEARFADGRDKKFHQRARTENGWTETGFAPVPFRLPQVLEAIAEQRTIYLCEGEKDVLAAEQAGLTATTNAGGALAWRPEHAEWLRGAGSVVIVADRDAPGYRRAERVMASLVGRVARVRVVQAATGKDLHEHLQAGHEVGDLEPIPHLDPFTPTGPARSPENPAAETDSVSAAPSLQEEGPDMSFAYGDREHTPAHDDTVDHISTQFSAFMRVLMMQLIERVRARIEAAREAAERQAVADQEAKARAEAQLAADQAAAEAKLNKLRAAGFANLDRRELADAVAEAVGWAGESEVARQSLALLRTHVRDRYGLDIDPLTGEVGPRGGETPALLAEFGRLEADNARGLRVETACDRMITMVAAEDLDQSTKEQLYAEIDKWHRDPSASRLGELTRTLADKGVGEQTRRQIRFVASYLGAPLDEVPGGKVDVISAVSPAAELRRMGVSLVDPGEEVKPAVDDLLRGYQDRLRVGNTRMTAAARAELDDAMSVLTPEDQEKVKARGKAIMANPSAHFGKLWPAHVDRDALTRDVQQLVQLAPLVEADTIRAGGIVEGTTLALMDKQISEHRKNITTAITTGEGLHQLEKDQLKAILRELEAGAIRDYKHLPQMLFADDRSGAKAEAKRSVQLAHDAAAGRRHEVEKVLDTNAVPRGTVRRTRDELTKVADTHAAMAAGRATLPDYEQTGVAERFTARLAAVGVSEPLRNKTAAVVQAAAGEAASMGKTANHIAEQWDQRREALTAQRAPQTPAPVAYDSPERRAGLQARLRAEGMDADQIAQHLAADAGQAKPASAAAAAGIKFRDEPRRTDPGAGVHRINHARGKGPGDHGRGR